MANSTAGVSLKRAAGQDHLPGVTILESSGLGRVRRPGLEEAMPLMPSLQDFFEAREEPHRTLFSVVSDEGLVERMSAAATKIIGDLDDPHTGFLFVMPVLKAYGLGRASKSP